MHIPKTGGTSVRNAAAAFFGEQSMLYDYGDAPRTSPIVRELFYESNEPERLADWIRANNIAFVAGHFKLERYAPLLPEADVITWVRDPVDRVRSLHQHRTLNHGETQSLEDFSERPRWRNLITEQTGTDPKRFEVIGTLERHNDSIELLNTTLDIGLKPRHDNSVAEPNEVDPDLRELMKFRNPKDEAFVLAARQRLDDPTSSL